MINSYLSITEARRLLPSLVQSLRQHPDRIFHISLRRRPAAELKAPPQIAKRGLAARRLLRLANSRKGKTSKAWRISKDVDSHLYE